MAITMMHLKLSGTSKKVYIQLWNDWTTESIQYDNCESNLFFSSTILEINWRFVYTNTNYLHFLSPISDDFMVGGPIENSTLN